MRSKSNKKKNCYAVYRGRVDEPTIYNTSWAVVHPLVIGAEKAVLRGFDTFEKAEDYMKDKGAMKPKVFPKEADITPPQSKGEACYAVADGRDPGIYPLYYNGAETQVNGLSGNCHQRCGSISEAERFIEDWKNSLADAYRKAIKEHLDNGIRPMDMNIEERAENMLLMADDEKESDDISEEMKALKIGPITE